MFLSGQTANWVSHTCGAEKEIKKNPAQSKNISEVNVGVKNTIVQKGYDVWLWSLFKKNWCMEEVDWKSVGLPTYVSSEAFFLVWQKLK